MAGGAGSVGGSGGMGQQPMGNASAQPQGGPFGGGMGGGQQSSGFGPGVNNFGGGSPFGMQQQQPMQNPNGPSQPTPMQMPQTGSQTPSWAGGY